MKVLYGKLVEIREDSLQLVQCGSDGAATRIWLSDDAGGDGGIEEVASYLTTTMLAHVYGCDAEAIARVILAIRENQETP